MKSNNNFYLFLRYYGSVIIMRVRRALISVSNKDGIVELAKGLEALGVDILSTGGTAKHLRDNGLGNIIDISDYTKQPEILSGRVKTLHPMIFGAILANRGESKHVDDLRSMGAEPIDLVVVNLYPFGSIVNKEGVGDAEAIELIDIGGVTLLRAAAKNFKDVAVLTNPSQYGPILEGLKSGDGVLSEETLKDLASDAFAHTAAYDSMIYNYFGMRGVLPDELRLSYNRYQELRYGENPYQKAVFYNDPYYKGPCIHNSVQLQGKELSYNNILDLSAAMNIVMDFEQPTSAIIKHTCPCGIASADTLRVAYENAYKSDSISAYGSIVGYNRELDADAAEAMRKRFIECVIAPGFAPEALEILKRKKKLRVMKTEGEFGTGKADFELVKVRGGVLLQTAEFPELKMEDLKFVTEKRPTEAELETMFFGWKAIKHIKSNGIILVKDTRTVGIGSGQMSRVDAVMIACRKAGEEAKGAVMASDAFFPFRDGVDEAAKAGVVAVIQPGGSIRDPEVLEAVKEHGMSMVYTGFRLFKH